MWHVWFHAASDPPARRVPAAVAEPLLAGVAVDNARRVVDAAVAGIQTHGVNKYILYFITLFYFFSVLALH